MPMSGVRNMGTGMNGDSQRSLLGSCPDCDAGLMGTDVLIRYETRAGQERTFAECPACRSVVHPAY